MGDSMMPCRVPGNVSGSVLFEVLALTVVTYCLPNSPVDFSSAWACTERITMVTTAPASSRPMTMTPVHLARFRIGPRCGAWCSCEPSAAAPWMPRAAWRCSVISDIPFYCRRCWVWPARGAGFVAVFEVAVDAGEDHRHEQQRRDGGEQQAADDGAA